MIRRIVYNDISNLNKIKEAQYVCPKFKDKNCIVNINLKEAIVIVLQIIKVLELKKKKKSNILLFICL